MIKALVKSGATKRKAKQKRRKRAAQTIISALLDDGMRQAEIGSYLGMTQPAVSNNFTGRTTPSLANLSLLIDLARQRRVDLPEQISWREL